MAATRFRAAIEQCNPNLLSGRLQEFPDGSDGDAVPLLGAYLADQGFGDFQFMIGHRRDDSPHGRHTHAWLEDDGLIVDITADQFPEVDQKVIVTRHSDWHATFECEEPKHPADFRNFDQETATRLKFSYAAILDEIARL